MKSCLALLVFALCLSLSPPSPASPQDVFAVPLVDKSGANSPFQINGQLLLRETARANELEWSWGEKITAKNLSNRSIVLFVATLMEVGRHPALPGRHSAPGNGPTYQLADDRFFNEMLIVPGESVVLRDTIPTTPNVACCINPLDKTRDAFGEYRLDFVQFADGSTFGDPAGAHDALALRDTIMVGLRELLQSYADGGEEGFAAKLKEPSVVSGTAPYKKILTKFSDIGVLAALGETKQIVAIAEHHAAMIAGTATTEKVLPPSP